MNTEETTETETPTAEVVLIEQARKARTRKPKAAKSVDETPATVKAARTRSAKKELVFVEGVGTTLVTPEAKPPKAAKKAAAAPKRDASIKTWTLAAKQVRSAIAEIKTRQGDEAKGTKFMIGTRVAPQYATTKAEALAAPIGETVELVGVEKGTNLPEVRGHGYVAHLFQYRGSDVVSTWTVWLGAETADLLTVDGKRVK